MTKTVNEGKANMNLKLEYIAIIFFATLTGGWMFFNVITGETESLVSGLGELISDFIDFLLGILGGLI
jgi:hypothetical protein